MISKKELSYLGELARIQLNKSEETKILKDLESILERFEELQEVNTDNVEPMSGGTFSKNIFRDKEFNEKRLSGRRSIDDFPETQDGFLKVPPVFD